MAVRSKQVIASVRHSKPAHTLAVLALIAAVCAPGENAFALPEAPTATPAPVAKTAVPVAKTAVPVAKTAVPVAKTAVPVAKVGPVDGSPAKALPKGAGKEAVPKESPAKASVPTPVANEGSPTPAASEGAVATGGQGQRPTAIEGRVAVKVKSADDARKAILKGLTEFGGHAALITDSELDLRVPPARLSALLTLVAAQGIVLDKSLSRVDLTLELANLEGQLKSKRTILGELRGLFDGSDVSATLKVENSMNELVKELESVKGRLRVTSQRARFAVVHVNFNYYEQQRINSLESRFEWLNSVKLPRFLGEF